MKIVQNSFNHNLYIHTLILNIENTFNTQMRKVLVIALDAIFLEALPPLQIAKKGVKWVKEGSKWSCKVRNAMNHML